MSRISLSKRMVLPIQLVTVVGISGTALAQTAAERAKQQARESGNAVSDGWITMKVHSQFIPEDALDGSDNEVDTRNAVVTLNGTVATLAGRARAVAIAKGTDGVKSVTDKLQVSPAASSTAAAREAGRKVGDEAKEAGRDAAREAREATGTTGRAITDGWIKSKIYSQYITEDALDDSDIDLDISKGAVTINGIVRSEAGSTRAAAIAKQTEGVKSVKNNLKVTPKAGDK
jgi:hyperosmotically inducible protein